MKRACSCLFGDVIGYNKNNFILSVAELERSWISIINYIAIRKNPEIAHFVFPIRLGSDIHGAKLTTPTVKYISYLPAIISYLPLQKNLKR
jgi:hypothetical protein